VYFCHISHSLRIKSVFLPHFSFTSHKKCIFATLFLKVLYMFPSLAKRKQHTQSIINASQHFLYKITGNDKLSGYFMIIFHWIIMIIPLLYLIIGKVNNLYYLLSILLYVVVFCHFYFRGCLLVRIERHLLKDKQWWGPWMFLFTPLEYISNSPMTSNLADRIIYSCIIIISVLILYRITI
jgi:hypothetical protein